MTALRPASGLEEVAARRVAVWGLGREGAAFVDLLRGRGNDPLVVDDDPAGAVRRSPEAVAPGSVAAPGRVDWSQVDVVVRAPGVSRYRHELAAAEAAGAVVTTAMAIWLVDMGEAPVLAVTGTKGKSTTAALAAGVLDAMGRRVELVGNIGVPVTETYARPEADAYVVEVSSYQAVDVATTPRVCVLTSLAPEHLDWHGGEEAYYRDKLHLLWAGRERAEAMGTALPPTSLAVNAGSPRAVRRTADHPRRLLYGPAGRVVVDDDGRVTVDGVPLAELGGWAVAGRHNWWNLCGAVAGVVLLEGEVPPADAVSTVVDGFRGLPSRGQVVGERGGVTFVDDALASNPFATVATLAAFGGRPLTLVAGGTDRGVDLGELAAELVRREPPPAVVAVGDGGQVLVEALSAAGAGDRVAVHRAGSLEGAVALAVSVTEPGGVVLFSPAQPTPAGEGDFRDRSRRFVAAAGVGIDEPASPTRSPADGRHGQQTDGRRAEQTGGAA